MAHLLASWVISYDAILRLCAVIFVLTIPLVLFLKWRKGGDEPAAAVTE